MSCDPSVFSRIIMYHPLLSNMNCKGLVSLTLLSAIFVAYMSTQIHILNQQCLKCLLELGFTIFTPLAITTPNIYSHHNIHRGKKRPESICDKFPPNLPPPDTNTTAFLCVDRRGCCNFTTVQSAIDAIGIASVKRTVIWINSGIYYEKVTVPRTKPNISFRGQGYDSTAIMWNDTANSSRGTALSASVSVFSDNFIAKNISFMNVAPIPSPGSVGAQAVAIRVGGDQAAFWGCGFFGSQDTLYDERGRHYFKECFIQGSIDFIYGNGRSIYENCQLSSIAKPVPPGSMGISGSITAHGRASSNENTGFVFLNCTVGGMGRIWLGRAWRPFSRVVFAYTFLSGIISPDGWNDFSDPTRDQTVFYGEYKCIGEGANTTMRVPYTQGLNETLASPFLDVSFIDGQQWLQPYQ